MKDMIALVVILPILLFIILGIVYIVNRAKNVHKYAIERNIALIKETLGYEVEYLPKGQLPFNIVGEDPSLHSNYANSCICRDMIKGNYKGIDYDVTNMKTKHSDGYGDIPYSIFSGFYILFHMQNSNNKPLYACSNNFWKDFNVKGNLHFKLSDEELVESNVIGNQAKYKLLLSSDWMRNSSNSDFFVKMQDFFESNKQLTSIYIYSDGKIGLAIRDYNLFDFYQGRLPELNFNASEITNVREIIQKDAKLIKNYLDNLMILLMK